MKFKNQKGQAVMLTVIVLSAVMITSLTMAYIYTANRIRFYAQVKDAYKMAHASEDLALLIKQAWDLAYVQNPTLPPGTILANVTAGGGPIYNNSCGTCAANQACVTNVDSAAPYCFSSAKDILDKKLDRVQTFVARLDKFFHLQATKVMHKNEVYDLASNGIAVKPKAFGWLIGESAEILGISLNSNPPEAKALSLACLDQNAGGCVPWSVLFPAAPATDCGTTANGAGCVYCDTAMPSMACMKVNPVGNDALKQLFRIPTGNIADNF